MIKNVVSVLAIIFISLVLFELFLQFSFPDTLFPGKNVNTTMEGPDYTNQLITNSLGIREIQEYTKEHPEIYRFAVIGDSFVFGNSADNNETIDSVTETLVNNEANMCTNKKSFEFLNFGKPGVGPAEYYSIMEFAESNYSPDAYIVGIYLGNDFLNSQESHNAPIKQLLKKCKTCVLFYSAIVSGQKESSSDQNVSDIPITVFNKAKNEPDFLKRSLLFSSDEYNTSAKEALESDLVKLQEFATQKGKPIVFVGMPHPLQVSASYESFYANIGFEMNPQFLTDHRVQSAFHSICLAHNLACFDSTPEVMTSLNVDSLYLQRDEHFQPAGYAVVAEKIANEVVPSMVSVCHE